MTNEIQTRTQLIQEQMQLIEKRIETEHQELAKANKRYEMAQKFETLISSSDLENRMKADGYRYFSSFLNDNEVSLKLEEHFSHYCRLESNAVDWQEKESLTRKRDLAWDYRMSVSKRTMNQETYEALHSDTKPTLGKLPSIKERKMMYLQPCFRKDIYQIVKYLGSKLK